MLTSPITIAVDTENTGTTENQVYSRFDSSSNRSTYIGDGHSNVARNTLGFFRSLPKKNGNFRGTAKTSLKFTEDITVTGVDGVSALTTPLICEVNFSIPVGATEAQQLELRQRVLALLDMDSIMTPLLNTQMI